MAIEIATWAVVILEIYLAIGLVVALLFARWGAARIDPIARNSTWGFRVVIIPGAMALWPYLAKRWLDGTTDPPEENNPHRIAARAAKGGAE